jgi:hypothetical protein
LVLEEQVVFQLDHQVEIQFFQLLHQQVVVEVEPEDLVVQIFMQDNQVVLVEEVVVDKVVGLQLREQVIHHQ